MKIDLHIGELVLYGLPPVRDEAIAAEVRRAIAAQLAQGAAWTADVARDVVDAGSFPCASASGRDMPGLIAASVSRAMLP